VCGCREQVVILPWFSGSMGHDLQPLAAGEVSMPRIYIIIGLALAALAIFAGLGWLSGLLLG